MSKAACSRAWCLGLFLVVAVLFRPHAVSANGPPPPDIWWFTFDLDAGLGAAAPVQPEGLQVIACRAPDCDPPALLRQFGACRDAACLPPDAISNPGLRGAYHLACAEERCRFVNYDAYQTDNQYGASFKLVAQFPDGAWESGVVAAPREKSYGNTTHWRVTVRGGALVLTPDEPGEGSPRVRFRSALRSSYGPSGFFFTQFVEIPVALVCLGWLFVKRAPGGAPVSAPPAAQSPPGGDTGHTAESGPDSAAASGAGRALMVFLINLVTFPIAWLFVPSLGRLQPTGTRALGIAGLALALLYGALLVVIYRTQGKQKKVTRIATLVSLPLAFLCAAAIVGIVAYGARQQLAETGLSISWIVPLAEGFAVLCEAALLALLHKPALPLWQAGLTSLLMNAASFFLGLLALGIWP